MPTEPQKLLTEQEVADIEKRRYAAVRSYHSGDDVNWFLTVGIPALCQTVRALKQLVEIQSRESDGNLTTIQKVLADNAALREQLAQQLETLVSCDSVLSYIYHRERSRLLPATQEQVLDTMREVEKITRRKP